MKGFWENLSQLAQGQLFSGGYLSRETVERLSAPRSRGKKVRSRPRRKRRMAAPGYPALKTETGRMCGPFVILRSGYQSAAISASPNSEHFTSVAPSIRRAKS